jgi:hypothetical protein
MFSISTLLESKGVKLENQRFTWKEMVGKPISKLDDDAFTRIRIILMNGIEIDALRSMPLPVSMESFGCHLLKFGE